MKIQILPLFKQLRVYDISSLNNVVKHKKYDLFIMHFNMRSLQKNIDKLITLLPIFLKRQISLQYQKQKLLMVNQ